VYEQPPCPAPNLIWTPGHWRFGLFGFFWVPGVWVPAPYTGALWTPSYWGWSGGRYAYHEGYWGPHIGFYGGVNYGGGYGGIGFAGGTWNGGVFAYNTAVVRVNTDVVRNVYINRTIVEQTTIINENHTSFNGGPNGVQHVAAPEEQIAEHESHTQPTAFQQQHMAAAKADPSSSFKNNGGHPKNLAVAKPLAVESHAAPAGFKPPPPRPVTELAKVQAPPTTIAATKTAITKTAAVKPPVPAKAAPMAETKPTPAPKTEAKTPPTTGTKPTPTLESKPAPKPETKPAPTFESKPAPKAETKSAPKTEMKTPPKSESMAAPKPAPKPETKPAPKPESKPGTKPGEKPKEK
jgi:hypothetical protein